MTSTVCWQTSNSRWTTRTSARPFRKTHRTLGHQTDRLCRFLQQQLSCRHRTDLQERRRRVPAGHHPADQRHAAGLYRGQKAQQPRRHPGRAQPHQHPLPQSQVPPLHQHHPADGVLQQHGVRRRLAAAHRRRFLRQSILRRAHLQLFPRRRSTEPCRLCSADEDDAIENAVLRDNNLNVIKHSPEFHQQQIAGYANQPHLHLAVQPGAAVVPAAICPGLCERDRRPAKACHALPAAVRHQGDRKKAGCRGQQRHHLAHPGQRQNRAGLLQRALFNRLFPAPAASSRSSTSSWTGSIC